MLWICDESGAPIAPSDAPSHGGLLFASCVRSAHLEIERATGLLPTAVSGGGASVTIRYGKTRVRDAGAMHAETPAEVASMRNALIESTGRFSGSVGATLAPLMPENHFVTSNPVASAAVRFGAYNGGFVYSSPPMVFTSRDWNSKYSVFDGPLVQSQESALARMPVQNVGGLHLFDINAAWPASMLSTHERFTDIESVELDDRGAYLVDVEYSGRWPILPHRNDGAVRWASSARGRIWADYVTIDSLLRRGASISIVTGFSSIDIPASSNSISAALARMDRRHAKLCGRAAVGRLASSPPSGEWVPDDGTATGEIIPPFCFVETELSGFEPFPRGADPLWSSITVSATNARVIDACEAAERAGFYVVWADTDCVCVATHEKTTPEVAASAIGIRLSDKPGDWGVRLSNETLVYFMAKGYVSKTRKAAATLPAWAMLAVKGET